MQASARDRRTLLVGLALIASSAVVFELRAQTAPALVPDQPSTSSTMQSFVIIFRQGPRELSQAEQAQRQQEISVWAREQIATGHLLQPRILGPEVLRPGDADEDSDKESDGAPLTALLFIAARDLAEAGRIAASHPGRNYGARVEVRSWAYPPGFQPQPSPHAR